MSDLIATFAAIGIQDVPVEWGAARTEAIAIGAESAQSSLAASPGECILSLLAEADCWISIGQDPTAGAIASSGIGTSRKLLAGTYAQYSAHAGDKVAVIQA